MSVKNFKFVSPGVFINEIDNSFIPRSAETIGPVVVGRSVRGLGMTPVKVQSYSEFVEMFGDTVPGGGGGDISRYGNLQSPMYGTYAAKAFLDANVAPLTYVRLLGQQDSNATSDGYAGWQTLNNPAATLSGSGGAYGMFVFPNSTTDTLGTGSLGAVFYVNSGSVLKLTGTMAGLAANPSESNVVAGGTLSIVQEGVGVVVQSDASGIFTMHITSSDSTSTKVSFGFTDSESTFVRKRFNTNPQLCSAAGTFYPTSAYKTYWLGESYEQTLRDNSLVGTQTLGVLLPLAGPAGDASTGPQYKRQASQEGKSGWVVGQDLGPAASFSIETMPKLFRLQGRGHGGWLHKNTKVSIERIRASAVSTSDYGTFSVVIRRLSDSDNAQEVLERFDLCTLDPTSVNFVARKIGDKYVQWSTANNRLQTYGDYPNQSKFVYVEMEADAEAGATDPLLLPFGYFGPPTFKGATNLESTAGKAYGTTQANSSFLYSGSCLGVQGKAGVPSSGYFGTNDWIMLSGASGIGFNSGSAGPAANGQGLTGSVSFPSVRLRLSASDEGFSDPTKANFGMQTTRTADSTIFDPSVIDYHNILKADYAGGGGGTDVDGITDHAYVFSLNDVVESPIDSGYYWLSGSRLAGSSVSSYTTLLDAGYDSFTMPFFGGFDGFDAKLPDPMYNKGIPGAGGSGTGTATDINSSPYHTWKRALDTVADPEEININMLVAPGLTVDSLTQQAVNICEARADTMALIDLSDVYIPPHEQYNSDKTARIGTTPVSAANALRDRRIDSSYGATFYPWVQTRDENTGRLLWIPPSVAMMGVLASSQRKTAVWFAPAGFNRGGLTDGAAGIPVMNVSERLTSKNRDTLYESNINPIASFPSSGIVVFGQKTLQEKQSALDRINVRRLVIYLKKQISVLSTQVLFEQNVQDTWNRFTSLVEPLLSNVKSQFGITDYRLILDETTTTPDLIDQNILYAKIMIKPARAIEYIAIDFVIMRTGASFDD
tara:strand:- start:1577 stop:4567 length:2991 start_codon:yes stop_codon:yes gene_type:complete